MIEITFTVHPDGVVLLEPVTIRLDAEDWDSPFETEVFLGEYPDVQKLKLFLSTAYRMYGHTFNLELHTPRHIWEAFKENGVKFTVNPDCPPDDFELPEGACY